MSLYNELMLKHFQNTRWLYRFHKESFLHDVDSTLYTIAMLAL